MKSFPLPNFYRIICRIYTVYIIYITYYNTVLGPRLLLGVLYIVICSYPFVDYVRLSLDKPRFSPHEISKKRTKSRKEKRQVKLILHIVLQVLLLVVAYC